MIFSNPEPKGLPNKMQNLHRREVDPPKLQINYLPRHIRNPTVIRQVQQISDLTADTSGEV